MLNVKRHANLVHIGLKWPWLSDEQLTNIR